jgi:sorbitol-specific phosphotransferase system component IIC
MIRTISFGATLAWVARLGTSSIWMVKTMGLFAEPGCDSLIMMLRTVQPVLICLYIMTFTWPKSVGRSKFARFKYDATDIGEILLL